MTSGLLTSRMIARAVQSALDQGAVFALLKRERQWRMLQRRWDSAWRLRAPWELIFSGCLGYGFSSPRIALARPRANLNRPQGACHDFRQCLWRDANQISCPSSINDLSQGSHPGCAPSTVGSTWPQRSSVARYLSFSHARQTWARREGAIHCRIYPRRQDQLDTQGPA